ncbi:hypothetical protein SPAN111604_00160 [Sphingomonas antarctica]
MPRCGQMVRVGDSDGQRIGCVATVDLDPRKQAFDHRMDLGLFRRAGADDGLLDLPGGVFTDGDAFEAQGGKQTPARLRELERRLPVRIDKYFFHARADDVMRDQQLVELFAKMRQPRRQRIGRPCRDPAVGDVREAISLRDDDSPARRAEAGIEAEDDQAKRSMMSSEIS